MKLLYGLDMKQMKEVYDEVFKSQILDKIEDKIDEVVVLGYDEDDKILSIQELVTDKVRERLVKKIMLRTSKYNVRLNDAVDTVVRDYLYENRKELGLPDCDEY